MSDPPIYHQLADEYLILDLPPQDGEQPATTMLPPAPAEGGRVRYGDAVDWARTPAEPPARSSGEQDHSEPWRYAGADADPPGAA